MCASCRGSCLGYRDAGRSIKLASVPFLRTNIMNDRYDLLIDTINKCNIYLEKCWISNETVLKATLDFLEGTMKEKKHSSALLLHTGSICYDAVAFVLCVLANIIFDENDAVEYATTFEKGITVSYGNDRWKYEGLYEGSEKSLQGKYVLRGDTGIKYVSAKAFSEISPYNGTAKTLSGKGIKADKSKRFEFLESVLKLKRNEIVAIPRTSTVIFMDKSELDYLLENTTISFPDVNKEYEILDLVTVTYYTPKNELRKRGNAGNNEPAIKVTNSIERARELIIEGEENAVLGFAAFRSDVYKKSALDFEELLKRRSLRYSWLISKLEYSPWIEAQLDDEVQNIKIFAFSSRVLKTVNTMFSQNNSVAINLCKETTTTADREYKGELVESNFLWSDYKRIKSKIFFIMNHSMEDDNVIQFCKWAYSMLRFYNNAFFTMQEYETVFHEDFKQLFEIQHAKISLFANLVKDKSEEVLAYIEKLFAENETHNAKRERIKSYIFDNNYNNVLFIIQNIRFENLFQKYIKENIRFKSFKYTIVPETKVKNLNLEKYDVVLFPALMGFDKVNPVDLIGARKSIVFLYDAQIKLYKKLVMDYIAYINKLDERNPMILIENYDECEDFYQLEENENQQIIEEAEQDANLQEAFMKVFLQSERYHSSEYFGNGFFSEGGLDAYRYGQFVSGEQIIFTKGYEAYVLDSVEGTVVEKKVDDLEAGDKLVFTINDNKTKDIVDELLLEICKRSEEITSSYNHVTGWKDKFRAIKEEKNWTYADIARLFMHAGCNVANQTIRLWLDPQSHIVGPKEKDKFIYIGKVMGNQEIVDNYLKYSEATSQIRSIRMKLLKLIENTVVADINGVHYDDDEMFGDIIERIREIAVIKQLEKIEAIEPFKIQINRANRPIES